MSTEKDLACGLEEIEEAVVCTDGEERQEVELPELVDEESKERMDYEGTNPEAIQSSDEAAEQQPVKPKNKKVIISVVAAITAVVLLVGGLLGAIIKNQKAQKAEEEYLNNLKLATSAMLIGAADAEEAGNLIKSVWYNTIYKKYDDETNKYTRSGGWGFNDDFNDSLKSLFADSEFVEQIASIESNRERVTKLMKKLMDPPEEYEEFEAIKDFYDEYYKFTGLVVNPSGSLSSFSQEFNESDSEVLNCYNKMKLYIQ